VSDIDNKSTGLSWDWTTVDREEDWKQEDRIDRRTGRFMDGQAGHGILHGRSVDTLRPRPLQPRSLRYSSGGLGAWLERPVGTIDRCMGV
jgi:hypothetical protein